MQREERVDTAALFNSPALPCQFYKLSMKMLPDRSMESGCVTGDRINGLADGISGNWYASFLVSCLTLNFSELVFVSGTFIEVIAI